jgi:hypothetical protein
MQEELPLAKPVADEASPSKPLTIEVVNVASIELVDVGMSFGTLVSFFVRCYLAALTAAVFMRLILAPVIIAGLMVWSLLLKR